MGTDRQRAAVWVMVLALVTPMLALAGTGELESEFRQACQTLTAGKGINDRVIARDRWVLQVADLMYAGTPRFWGDAAPVANPHAKPELADPIPAIVDLHRQLEDLGIELYLVPAPISELVYPESVLGTAWLPPGTRPPYLHPLQAEFFEVLRSKGVRVVDVLPLLLAHRDDEHTPLYTRSDPHWTGQAVVLAAGELARLISANPWYRSVDRVPLTAEWTVIERQGPLYRDMDDPDGLLTGLDTTHLRQVTRASGAPLELRNPDSPVVVIGDSNVLHWMVHQAALFHQLAYELGFPVDVIAGGGAGANQCRIDFIRTIRDNPGYLGSKKVVIWCFTSRLLSTAIQGWPKLPLQLPGTEPVGTASNLNPKVAKPKPESVSDR